MRPVRIVILVVAAVSAIGLALLVRGMMAPKPQPAATLASAPQAKPMARVLVAKRDLPIGTKLTTADMGWQDWPAEALNAAFVTDGAPPQAKTDDKGLLKTATKAATEAVAPPPAMEAFEGALVREPIAAGEPMTARKVVRGGEGGYMSVMLAPGMRAIGVPVNSETGAGGFILPGDRVDVLQARRSEEAEKGFVTQAVLTNVRVLAIDQATEPGKDSKTMVGATVLIGFISLSVWAHHMFVVGLSPAANTFFTLSTMAIAVPTGIKIFNWLGTMWGGKIRFRVPMLWCTGFLFSFVIAGLTGVMLAVVPWDWQLSDSYFVVAHFHFVLIGGLLFTLFAAIYFWFPKVTGKMLDERLGKLHFWVFATGFYLTFVPMHFPGLLGMPRRIYTYEAGRGWDELNLISSIGVAVQLVGLTFFLWNVVRSLLKGDPAGDDPWDAWTLEWSTTSPPPEYNFEQIPVVRSRRPLWDLKHPEDPDWRYE